MSAWRSGRWLESAIRFPTSLSGTTTGGDLVRLEEAVRSGRSRDTARTLWTSCPRPVRTKWDRGTSQRMPEETDVYPSATLASGTRRPCSGPYLGLLHLLFLPGREHRPRQCTHLESRPPSLHYAMPPPGPRNPSSKILSPLPQLVGLPP